MTLANSSEALASLVRVVHSAEASSAQQRATVSPTYVHVFGRYCVLLSPEEIVNYLTGFVMYLFTLRQSASMCGMMQAGPRNAWKTNEFSVTCPFKAALGDVAVVLLSKLEVYADQGISPCSFHFHQKVEK